MCELKFNLKLIKSVFLLYFDVLLKFIDFIEKNECYKLLALSCYYRAFSLT